LAVLAAVLTTVELEPDPPVRASTNGAEDESVGLLCGKCTRCLEACPTAAITRPGVVDARLCISYQTMKTKASSARAPRKNRSHLYGCDVCLEICPWNRFAQESRRIRLVARDEIARLTLKEFWSSTRSVCSRFSRNGDQAGEARRPAAQRLYRGSEYAGP